MSIHEDNHFHEYYQKILDKPLLSPSDRKEMLVTVKNTFQWLSSDRTKPLTLGSVKVTEEHLSDKDIKVFAQCIKKLVQEAPKESKIVLKALQAIYTQSSSSGLPPTPYDAEIVAHANYEEEPLLAKIEQKLSELLKEKQKHAVRLKKLKKRKRKKQR